MATNKPYKKLPGRHRGFVSGETTLWMGSDLLLLVTRKGTEEDYKRFYYNDIQSFIIRKTIRSMIQNLLLLLPLFFFVWMTIIADDEVLAIFMGGFAAMFFLGLAWNFFRGTSCTCHIKTRVQTEKLSSITKLVQAKKIINKVSPLIAQAQGRLPGDTGPITGVEEIKPVDDAL